MSCDGTYVVRDYDGAVYGRFLTEPEAVERRDSLGAGGVECWIDAPPRYLVGRDPGDEQNDEYIPATGPCYVDDGGMERHRRGHGAGVTRCFCGDVDMSEEDSC